ncbi:MAG: hypothetical protein AB7R89_12825 [Dehalococcoidia bacterium]
MKKQDALEVMQTLPEEFDPEELMYRLYVLTKIERAERAIEERGIIPDEDLDREPVS